MKQTVNRLTLHLVRGTLKEIPAVYPAVLGVGPRRNPFAAFQALSKRNSLPASWRRRILEPKEVQTMLQQTVAASLVASPADPGTTELKAEWVQHRFQSLRITRSVAEPGSEAGSTILTEEWWSLDLPAEVPVEAFTQAVSQLTKRAA